MVQKSIHTIIAFGVAAGILLTIFAVSFSPSILRLMGTPEEVLPNSIIYFRVYFSGSLAFVLYNIFVGILQATGDRPTSSDLSDDFFWRVNVVLDVFFVAGRGMGVGSAAFATGDFPDCQRSALSDSSHESSEEYRVSLRKIGFDLSMLRQIIGNGLPAGLQNSHYFAGQRSGSVQHQSVSAPPPWQAADPTPKLKDSAFFL